MAITAEQYELVRFYLQYPFTDYNIQVKTGVHRTIVKKIRNGQPVAIIGFIGNLPDTYICQTPQRYYQGEPCQ